MDFLISTLVNMIVILAVFPFIPFILSVWIGMRMKGYQKKQSIKLAMDITTFFLIIGVAGIYDQIVSTELKGFYFIFMLLLLMIGILGGAQARTKGQVHLPRIVQAVWRIFFFLLSGSYIVLMCVGLVIEITK